MCYYFLDRRYLQKVCDFISEYAAKDGMKLQKKQHNVVVN